MEREPAGEMDRENPIAEFAQTVTLRVGLKAEEGGTLGVVQAKDVGYDGKLDLSGVSWVRELHWKSEPPLLRPNDVILQTRGTSYRSSIVPKDAPRLVAASGVYALRPRVDRVEPLYLVMVFNLPVSQIALRQIATGSHILNLRREALNSFLSETAVALPPLAEQRRFVLLGDAIQRAHAMESELVEVKAKMKVYLKELGVDVT
jgi:hypothetical protein